MSDSEYLDHLMLRVSDHRAKHPQPKLSMLIRALADLQLMIERGSDIEGLRREAIEIGAASLRLSVESLKGTE